MNGLIKELLHLYKNFLLLHLDHLELGVQTLNLESIHSVSARLLKS